MFLFATRKTQTLNPHYAFKNQTLKLASQPSREISIVRLLLDSAMKLPPQHAAIDICH